MLEKLIDADVGRQFPHSSRTVSGPGPLARAAHSRIRPGSIALLAVLLCITPGSTGAQPVDENIWSTDGVVREVVRILRAVLEERP